MTASRVSVGKIIGGPDIGAWLVWCPPCGMSLAVASWSTAMRVANRHARDARNEALGRAVADAFIAETSWNPTPDGGYYSLRRDDANASAPAPYPRTPGGAA